MSALIVKANTQFNSITIVTKNFLRPTHTIIHCTAESMIEVILYVGRSWADMYCEDAMLLSFQMLNNRQSQI